MLAYTNYFETKLNTISVDWRNSRKITSSQQKIASTSPVFKLTRSENWSTSKPAVAVQEKKITWMMWRRVMKVMYFRGWTMAIKRSSTKRHKFTTDVLLNNNLIIFTQDRKCWGQSQVFVMSHANREGITLKPTQKSATASETINALVLVRRFRLLQTRKIVNPFPMIARNERAQPRIQNQVSILTVTGSSY